jgi:hypothetical protein
MRRRDSQTEKKEPLLAGEARLHSLLMRMCSQMPAPPHCGLLQNPQRQVSLQLYLLFLQQIKDIIIIIVEVSARGRD